ncbi:hypothetical protein O3M35_011606 [Rhynocoris fuscipes]|uniref:Peptidase S1 domain-containing protein n=1 Tax=Rhynocoris fuscipes TaxID=488301 RepID=A0AAW1CVU1_9HEMI
MKSSLKILMFCNIGLLLIYLQIISTWSACERCLYKVNIPAGDETHTISSSEISKEDLNGAECVWNVKPQYGHILAMECRSSAIIVPNATCNTNYLLIRTPAGSSYSYFYCLPFNLQVKESNIIAFQLEDDSSEFTCTFKSYKIPNDVDHTSVDADRTSADADHAVAYAGRALADTDHAVADTGRALADADHAVADASCKCGFTAPNSESQIDQSVNGSPVRKREFPSFAVIYDRKVNEYWCGGTIVSPTVIISLASCFLNRTKGDGALVDLDNYAIYVGVTHIHRIKIHRPYRISTVTLHESYKAFKDPDDIALVFTTRHILFSDIVHRACLPFPFDDGIIKTLYLTALGWRKNPTAKYDKILSKTKIYIISNSICVTHKRIKFFPGKNLCILIESTENDDIGDVENYCQVDVGSPSYYIKGGRQFLLGMFTFDTYCKTQSSAVINIRHYLPWIEEHVPEGTFCHASPEFCGL